MDATYQKIEEIVAADPRCKPEAYVFLLAALEDTIGRIGKRRHVTGQELCEGLRVFALKQYGMMARNVLESWGCRTTDDFGSMVYNLIGAQLLSRTEQDSINDFHDVYGFEKAFTDGYTFAPGQES